MKPEEKLQLAQELYGHDERQLSLINQIMLVPLDRLVTALGFRFETPAVWRAVNAHVKVSLEIHKRHFKSFNPYGHAHNEALHKAKLERMATGTIIKNPNERFTELDGSPISDAEVVRRANSGDLVRQKDDGTIRRYVSYNHIKRGSGKWEVVDPETLP